MGGEAIFFFYLGLNNTWSLLQNEGLLFQNDHNALEINIPTEAKSQNCNFRGGST